MEENKKAAEKRENIGVASLEDSIRIKRMFDLLVQEYFPYHMRRRVVGYMRRSSQTFWKFNELQRGTGMERSRLTETLGALVKAKLVAESGTNPNLYMALPWVYAMLEGIEKISEFRESC